MNCSLFKLVALLVLLLVIGTIDLNAQNQGVLNGLFTVNANGTQVHFSQGNLQYQASTNTWRFAGNQWDYVGTQQPYEGQAGGNVNGSDNVYISSTYSGWIDLFGWGTSGWDSGNSYYQPWSSQNNGDPNTGYGYGPTNGTTNHNTDWGYYNPINNGGNLPNLWRTLDVMEWQYILYYRTTASGIRFAMARVNNVDGLLLLPDDWNTGTYLLNNTNNSNAGFNSNVISLANWNNLEQNGAVFLPVAGFREGTLVEWVKTYGRYWSASCCGTDKAFNVSIIDAGLTPSQESRRYCGYSVRLVCSEPIITSHSIEVTPNPAEGGSITGAGIYAYGHSCTLAATANEGFTFVNWTKDGTVVSTESEYSFVVTEDAAFVANFGLPLTILGYGTGSGNYHFVASPLVDNTAPVAVEGMTDGANYDLYRFDQGEVLEWQNYKAHADDFMLVNGQGYLYANAEEVNLVFRGAFNEDATKEVSLVYDTGKDCAGWNLVGNPFPTQAYVDRSYYVMNEEGTAIEPVALSASTAIPVCTGVMVKAENTGETVVFSRTPSSKSANIRSLQITVVQEGDNSVYDKAIVSFNAGEELEKMVFSEGKVKLYIHEDGKEYAIACAPKQGEMPLHFKAMENGNYTLKIQLEGLEMGYLHLFDTKTGTEVNLLRKPSYTFEAQSGDEVARFKLVFK